MAREQRYDALVIGDGQAGGPLSTTLVAAGRRTAVIEREQAGGTCMHVGCTRTKTIMRSGVTSPRQRRRPDAVGAMRARRSGVALHRSHRTRLDGDGDGRGHLGHQGGMLVIGQQREELVPPGP